jgi:cobalt-zinc-cadmium efflux system outer membrane protein
MRELIRNYLLSAQRFLCRTGSARTVQLMRLTLTVSGACLTAAGQINPTTVQIPRHLTLAEAESLLLQRNLAIAINRQQLEATEAEKLIASYKPNPTVQLGAEQYPVYSTVVGSVPRFVTTNSDAGAQPTYTFLFSKLIERGGKREFRTKQAEAKVGAAKAQVLDIYRQQLLQLRQAYGGAMLARMNVDLARQALREYEQTEKLTATRVQAGDAPQVERYRIRAGKLPYQQAVLQAESAYRQSCLDVLNLLNSQRQDVIVQPAPPGAKEEPAGAPLDIAGAFPDRAPLLLLDELKRIALQERPDIEIARRTREAGQLGTRLAEAQRKRDISVGTEYQRVGSDSSVGVIASFSLFLYNNQRAGIAQARALERAGDFQLRQSEMQTITDVEKAWEQYQAAQQSLKVFSAENLEQTQRLRDVAFFSYQQGAISLFELLDAQRTLLQARTGYNQARFDLQNSLWVLEAAIGRSVF